MRIKNFRGIVGVFILPFFLTACAGFLKSRDEEKKNLPSPEAVWVRNGEPLVFEDDRWFPDDAIELLLDSEVTQVGTYRDVPIYIENIDVRPYNRLYTRFGRNKFRIFHKDTKEE